MRAGDYAGFIARMDPRAVLATVTPLDGGISASIVRVEVDRIEPPVFVIRSHGAIDRARNPNIARDEFHLLERLAKAGLRVPEPLFFDTARDAEEIAAFALTWVDGTSRFDDLGPAEWRELGHVLAEIHGAAIDTAGLVLPPPRPPIDREPPTPDEAIWESRSRRSLASRPPSAVNEPRVLHGDFWLGNVLWSDGLIAAVIDWEDFGYGDPLADLGLARLELHWACGPTAVRIFTDAYFAAQAIDRTDLPYWDIAATLHFSHKLESIAADVEDLGRLERETKAFLAAAYERLPSR